MLELPGGDFKYNKTSSMNNYKDTEIHLKVQILGKSIKNMRKK